MEYKITASDKYLKIPVWAGRQEESLEIFIAGEKRFEFRVPLCGDEDGECDYYSYLNVNDAIGQTILFRGNFPQRFFEQICTSTERDERPIARPLLHYTAPRGWINDPNGLVYHDGVYQLYYQYNPMNTAWQNMSWGHAVSRDLLHFAYKGEVLYPDENGAAYSGCGLVNERGLLGLPKDALLFFYTAAGGNDPWSKDADFTQRLAYSTDGGETLVKVPEPVLKKIAMDSRDPKIFWHEETNAYVMVLWIQGNEFGIFRSENLKDWAESSRIVLKDAWECPDLFPLALDGKNIWVFMSADGFYFLGDFDGYTFHTDGVQRRAYMTGLPYAAQTYSGTGDRVIAVPWLRTHNTGKLYTGMMGLPRELGLVRRGSEILLTLLPVREYEQAKQSYPLEEQALDGQPLNERPLDGQPLDERPLDGQPLNERPLEEQTGKEQAAYLAEEAAAEIALRPCEGEVITIRFFSHEMQIRENVIFYRTERTVIPEGIEDIHILIDRGILEIYANSGTRNVYYETDLDDLKGKIAIRGCQNQAKLFIWRP